jgi:hypothetical protein
MINNTNLIAHSSGPDELNYLLGLGLKDKCSLPFVSRLYSWFVADHVVLLRKGGQLHHIAPVQAFLKINGR